jgi:hypothetical protein
VTGATFTGGLLGMSVAGVVDNCFCDTLAAGQTPGYGEQGKSTAEMKTDTTFIHAGWQFMCGTADSTDHWGLDPGGVFNSGYPHLAWQTNGEPANRRPLPPAVGNGTSGNPYQIATIHHLYWIAKDPARWDKHYVQTADINAAATMDLCRGWQPPGINADTAFTGSYDGQGHVIDSLWVNRPLSDLLGLFGYCNANAAIHNLGVVNARIIGKNGVGVLAGMAEYATIGNCHAHGSVTGQQFIGGLIGGAGGAAVRNSYAAVSVQADTFCGGLLGFAAECTVSACYSSGHVNSNAADDGLVGISQECLFTSCFWDVETSGQDSSAGGMGRTTAEMKKLALYASAQWDFVTETMNGTDDTWDIDRTGTVNNGYPFLAWQNGDTLLLGPDNFTRSATAPAAGNGTSGDPYQIAGLENLYWLAASNANWDKHYIQTADINAIATLGWPDSGWAPIGNNVIKFSGMYNGQGHTIEGLSLRRTGTNHQGLFGYTATGAVLESVGVTLANITGSTNVGGLVGNAYEATVRNCYSTGRIAGTAAIGGLLGDAYSTVLTNSYSMAEATGSHQVGGLAGNGYSATISYCFSAGRVAGTSAVGGLLGGAYASTVDSCCWDIETSGQDTSAGGTGKTSAEMKLYETFSRAGWDFMLETANGSADIWGMDYYAHYNHGYPFLAWQTGHPLPRQSAMAPASGAGTEGDPYHIANLDNLYWIAVDPSRWDKHYIQVADINAWDTRYWPDRGWTPIGLNMDTAFTGTYHGQGHVIDSLFIHRAAADFQGLFGLTVGAHISNLGVTNTQITGQNGAGGLAGAVFGTGVSGCYTSGHVTAKAYSGGLAGGVFLCLIDNCYSLAIVTADTGAGGLAGGAETCTLNTCYSAGEVTGSVQVGGLLGYGSGAMANGCFWDRQTSGLDTSAGGTGITTSQMHTLAVLSCAQWDFETETINGTADHWDLDGSGVYNQGYPFLSWQNNGELFLGPGSFPQTAAVPESGDGTSNNPYQIAGLENLYWVAATSSNWDKHFIQTADIDAIATLGWGDTGWTPIGTAAVKFTGTYNGQGYAIDGLSLRRDGTDNQGLFGYTETGATIENLGLTFANIKGGDNVGALIGKSNNATIRACCSAGHVAGENNVGGLTGDLYSAALWNCYSRAEVAGINNTGGLTGNSYNSTIRNCYSAGPVAGETNAGGLVGDAYNSAVDSCFWDTLIAQQSASAGGAGTSTAAMQDPSTFFAAGWDPAVWYMDAGVNGGYPYLQWQDSTGTPVPVVLTAFTASVAGHDLRLAWRTVSETDNYGFEVQRLQLDQANAVWGAVGFVPGMGGGSRTYDYTFTDEDLPVGRYAYQLKQLDVRGAVTYSRQVEVTVAGTPVSIQIQRSFNAYQIPDGIRLMLLAGTPVTVDLYNAVGRRMQTRHYDRLSAGTHDVPLTLSKCPAGIYCYRISTTMGTRTGKLLRRK